jgi:hypothetical protein
MVSYMNKPITEDQYPGWYSTNSIVVQDIIPTYVPVEFSGGTDKTLISQEDAVLECIQYTKTNINTANSHLEMLEKALKALK